MPQRSAESQSVADVEGGRFERDVAAVSDRLPAAGTIKLHFPTLTLKERDACL